MAGAPGALLVPECAAVVVWWLCSAETNVSRRAVGWTGCSALLQVAGRVGCCGCWFGIMHVNSRKVVSTALLVLVL